MKPLMLSLLLSIFAIFSSLSHAAFARFSLLSHAVSLQDNCKYLPGIYEYKNSDQQEGSSVAIESTNDGYKMILKIWEDGKNYPDIVTQIKNCKDGRFTAEANGQALYYGLVDENQLILTNFYSVTYQRKK